MCVLVCMCEIKHVMTVLILIHRGSSDAVSRRRHSTSVLTMASVTLSLVNATCAPLVDTRNALKSACLKVVSLLLYHLVQAICVYTCTHLLFD